MDLWKFEAQVKGKAMYGVCKWIKINNDKVIVSKRHCGYVIFKVIIL